MNDTIDSVAISFQNSGLTFKVHQRLSKNKNRSHEEEDTNDNTNSNNGKRVKKNHINKD